MFTVNAYDAIKLVPTSDGGRIWMHLIINHRSLSVNRNQTLCYFCRVVSIAVNDPHVLHAQIAFKSNHSANTIEQYMRNIRKLCSTPDQTWRLNRTHFHLQPNVNAPPITHQLITHCLDMIFRLQFHKKINVFRLWRREGYQFRLSVNDSAQAMYNNSSIHRIIANRPKIE